MGTPKKIELAGEYAGLKLLAFTIGLMPWSAAVKTGEWLGVAMTKVVRKRYQRSIRDIQQAFPNKSPEEVRQIALESWRNIGRIAAETAKATTLSYEEILSKLEFRNTEKLFKYDNDGKGGIIHVGHFANWELFGLGVSKKFKRATFIVRPMSNPFVDKLLLAVRKSKGADVISAYKPFFSCFRALKKGAMLGILSDQSVPSSKLYMDFLGRPAEVAPMTAMLSIKMKVPVFPVRLFRENGKLVAEAEETIYPPEGEFSKQMLYDYTEKLKNKYEEWIRKDPSSWLWAHNRWKREKECIKYMAVQQKELAKEAAARKKENKNAI